MHKNMLGLQHLKQLRVEEHKKRAAWEYAKQKTDEIQEHVRHVRHENM